MKTFLLILVAAFGLAGCQSSTKPQISSHVPPEENAAPTADTTSRVK